MTRNFFSIKNNSQTTLNIFLEPWGDKVQVNNSSEVKFIILNDTEGDINFCNTDAGIFYLAKPGVMIEVYMDDIKINTISCCIEAS
jgi:hypothetical protein